jgi:glycosyltransferase involved in cell wall biosynthesis
MKILFVSHAASLTGAPKFVFELAKLFAHRHEVILVTKQGGTLLKQAIANNPEGIHYIDTNNSHEVSRSSFPEKVETARKLIEQYNPDFVYVNSVASGEWVVASRLCGVKNLLHVHEMKKECLSQVRMRCVTLDIMEYADFVLYPSKDVEQDAVQFFDPVPKASAIVDYFFDCDAILENARTEEPLPQNAKGLEIDRERPIVCACGVASHRKGVDFFFEAARQLPQLQFLWVGKWRSDEMSVNPIESKFSQDSLANFFLSGEVKNPHFYLNLADIFVLTSREDPQPLIVFEALILGKQAMCFSGTGGTRFVLDRYGYVLHGEPSVERLVSFLDRIFPATSARSFIPTWLDDMKKAVSDRYGKQEALAHFEQLIGMV